MFCKSSIIDGLEYKPVNAESSSVKIVILQRGWVMVGRYSKEGNDCKLANASVIRNWGTTRGLGEIAAEGPKSDTKLDPTNGLVEFHALTVIATVQCAEEKWASYLK